MSSTLMLQELCFLAGEELLCWKHLGQRLKIFNIYTSPLTYLESCLDMFGADALELLDCLVRLQPKDQIEQHLYPKH